MTHTDDLRERAAKAMYNQSPEMWFTTEMIPYPEWDKAPVYVKANVRIMARAALAAAGPEIASFPSPDFEWDAESIIEAREDAGEPPDPDTAQRTAEIAHDVLTTFQITLSTYPFSNLNTVAWLVSEMVRITEERAAAGPEADWLDAALDSVHPMARVVDMNYGHGSKKFDVQIEWPVGDADGNSATADGTGANRTAAIKDAIATALAAKQEGDER